jgi:hypothetical protein
VSGIFPWIVPAIGLVAGLAWKGYLRLPFPLARPATPPAPGPAVTPAGPPQPMPILSSHELGVMFAAAVRREAEAEIAESYAARAREELKAQFSAPFSGEPPAPPRGGHA